MSGDNKVEQQIGATLEELLKAAAPALKQFSAAVDRTAEVGRERFEKRKEGLEEKRRRLDEELDNRWR